MLQFLRHVSTTPVSQSTTKNETKARTHQIICTSSLRLDADLVQRHDWHHRVRRPPCHGRGRPHLHQAAHHPSRNSMTPFQQVVHQGIQDAACSNNTHIYRQRHTLRQQLQRDPRLVSALLWWRLCSFAQHGTMNCVVLLLTGAWPMLNTLLCSSCGCSLCSSHDTRSRCLKSKHATRHDHRCVRRNPRQSDAQRTEELALVVGIQRFWCVGCLQNERSAAAAADFHMSGSWDMP